MSQSLYVIIFSKSGIILLLKKIDFDLGSIEPRVNVCIIIALLKYDFYIKVERAKRAESA